MKDTFMIYLIHVGPIHGFKQFTPIHYKIAKFASNLEPNVGAQFVVAGG